MLHAAITWLGEVGSGGEASPLSPTSAYSEILRVLQLGIAAGVFYVIKQMREGHKGSDETHATILSDLKDTNTRLDALVLKVDSLTKEVGKVTKGGPEGP
jgi:hypothetical protein